MKRFVFALLMFTVFVAGYSPVAGSASSTKAFINSSTYTNVLICVSSTASKFHAYKCYGLNNCTHDIASVSVSTARSKGYTACGICYK